MRPWPSFNMASKQSKRKTFSHANLSATAPSGVNNDSEEGLSKHSREHLQKESLNE